MHNPDILNSWVLLLLPSPLSHMLSRCMLYPLPLLRNTGSDEVPFLHYGILDGCFLPHFRSCTALDWRAGRVSSMLEHTAIHRINWGNLCSFTLFFGFSQPQRLKIFNHCACGTNMCVQLGNFEIHKVLPTCLIRFIGWNPISDYWVAMQNDLLFKIFHTMAVH